MLFTSITSTRLIVLSRSAILPSIKLCCSLAYWYSAFSDKSPWLLASAIAAMIFGRSSFNNFLSSLWIFSYQIVGDYESDIKNKKLSVSSPLARGLINKTVNDVVEINSPKGQKSYTIKSVKYVWI